MDDKAQRLRAGDTLAFERESGEWMKGVVVLVEDDGVDVVVDGEIREGETLSATRTVRDDARYVTAMEVVSTGPGRSRVRVVGDWQRVQMREHVRVSVFGVRMHVGSGDRTCPGDAFDNRLPRLVDLSAGGLSFESNNVYSTGEVLDLEFSLPQGGPLTVRGEVVRIMGRRNEDSGPCRYGVRYCGISEATRVKIMTWVFAEQSRRFRGDGKREDTPGA